MKKFNLEKYRKLKKAYDAAVTSYNLGLLHFSHRKIQCEMKPKTIEKYEIEIARLKGIVDGCRGDFKAEKKRIEEIINPCQAKARERMLDVNDISEALKNIEKRLNIPKNKLAGVTVYGSPHCQSFPRAYKYTPMATFFEAVHDGKKWIITEVCRDNCGRPSCFNIALTEAAKEAIISNFSAF